MSKIESVQGTLSRKTWTKSMTLGETTYGFAKEYTFETGLKEGDLSNNCTLIPPARLCGLRKTSSL